MRTTNLLSPIRRERTSIMEPKHIASNHGLLDLKVRMTKAEVKHWGKRDRVTLNARLTRQSLPPDIRLSMRIWLIQSSHMEAWN